MPNMSAFYLPNLSSTNAALIFACSIFVDLHEILLGKTEKCSAAKTFEN